MRSSHLIDLIKKLNASCKKSNNLQPKGLTKFLDSLSKLNIFEMSSTAISQVVTLSDGNAVTKSGLEDLSAVLIQSKILKNTVGKVGR